MLLRFTSISTSGWLLRQRTVELLTLAASLEQQSEHPSATAIVRGAKDRGIALQQVNRFDSITGGGVTGRVNGREILIGKPKFIRDRMSGAEELEQRAATLQDQGQSTQIRAALQARTGQPTIPQVFVGGQWLGGCMDTLAAWRDGRMQQLLQAQGVAFDARAVSNPDDLLPGWLQPRERVG